MTTTTTRDDLTARLRRTLANMRTVVRRPASDLTGRNARGVSGHYSTAYGLLLRLEDVAGVEYAAPFGDRLTALRIEAMERGLLSPADVLDGETRAAAECPTPDAMRLLRDVRETLADESNMTASVPEPKRTRVRVRTSVRPGAVERIGATLTGAGFAVEPAPGSTLYVERGSVVDAGEPVETFAVKMTDAAAGEVTMSVADTMPDGAEPARVEVAEAVRAVPRRGGVVRLTAPAYAWLLDWLRAETEDRATSRYTDPEMFGAWRALLALRSRMEAEAPALVARAVDISRETGAWIVDAFKRAEHEQRHNILPAPRDDAGAASLVVNFGHGEYAPAPTDGLAVVVVFNPYADEHDDDDDDALLAAARAAGAGAVVDVASVGFSIVLRLTGSRDAHERGLASLLDELRGVSTTSDDDFYDYFPSGVRAASAWCTALYGDAARVEAVLAETLDAGALETLRAEGRL